MNFNSRRRRLHETAPPRRPRRGRRSVCASRDGVRATRVGKYTKLVELLAELQFPEVVCLQEAYDLVEISRGGKSALTDRMYSMFADKSGLGVLAFSFDAQMSRHRRAGTPSTRRARRPS